MMEVIYSTEISVDLHRTTRRYVSEYRDIFIVTVMKTSNQMINSEVLVRKRTIPTERPQSVGEVSANFS
jgi:hypothetical protein